MVLRGKNPQQIASHAWRGPLHVRALSIEDGADHALLELRTLVRGDTCADSEGYSPVPGKVQLSYVAATQSARRLNGRAELQPGQLLGSARSRLQVGLPPGIECLPVLQPRHDGDPLRGQWRVGFGDELLLEQISEVLRTPIRSE